MIELKPFPPRHPDPRYTNRQIVYFECRNIGMIAQNADRWFVSMHPSDPVFTSKEDAIEHLLSLRIARSQGLDV